MRLDKKPIIWGLLCLGLFLLFLNSEGLNNQNPSITQRTQHHLNYSLALTWHNGFCKNNSYKAECKKAAISPYAQNNFVLHGLWPGPKGQYYCDKTLTPYRLDQIMIERDKKASRWHQLPDLKLDPQLKKALFEKMPGTLSFLHRHEWIKHGSCFIDRSPNSYYAISLKLQDSFNDTVLKEFIKMNKDKMISNKQIKNAFVKIFGSKASQSISLKCKTWQGRSVVTEIRIALKANLDQLNNISIKSIPNILDHNISQSCSKGLLI